MYLFCLLYSANGLPPDAAFPRLPSFKHLYHSCSPLGESFSKFRFLCLKMFCIAELQFGKDADWAPVLL
ncbi:hypothetical protein Ancab_000768, partial [Ancistrocladus abbreviatus]